jgi:ribonuclease D
MLYCSKLLKYIRNMEQKNRYIDNTEALNTLIQDLEGSILLALDTEFIREKTYSAQLCLLQISNGNISACVDPFACESLEPLFDFIYQTDITKIFHAGRQDLEIFFDLRGELPQPIFDTQLATTVLGQGDQIGYERLVKHYLNISLDKSQTRTDWSQRPLTPEQLDYAANDVIYLWKIYPLILQDLDQQQRLDWLDEDFQELSSPTTYQVDLDNIWKKVKGTQRLSGKRLCVVRALAKWREQQAQQSNQPRRWILSDEKIILLAQKTPDQANKVKQLLASKEGDPDYSVQLAEIIQLAKKCSESESPITDKIILTNELSALVDITLGVIKTLGSQHNISPTQLATRKDIEKLVYGDNDIPLFKGWRRIIAGKKIISLLQGSLKISVKQKQLQLE